MIELSADETMLLLIAKGWEHVNVPRNEGECRDSYIQRVLKHRCYGREDAQWPVEVDVIYSVLVEKLVTMRELLQVLSPRRNLRSPFSQDSISESYLRCLWQRNVNDLELDMTLVVQRDS